MPWQTAPVMVIMVGAFTVSGLMMPAFQRLINGGKVTSTPISVSNIAPQESFGRLQPRLRKFAVTLT